MTFAADIFAGRRVAVLGLGRSGLACARALRAGGAEVLAWDDGEAGRARAAQAGLALTDLRDADFSTLAALVLSPGVPLTHPEPHWSVRKARAAGVEIIGDTEVFHRQARKGGAKIIAVTGTNGKSTTTALIGHVLKGVGLGVHVGGNIGTAVCDLPEPGWGRIYVIEMSSYQIDLSPTFRPDVGILLNITPDHLDRHGTLAHYAEVKARLFANMGEGGTAVISVDDEWSRKALAAAPEAVKKTPVSVRDLLDDGVCAAGGVLQERVGGQTVKGVDLTIMKSLRGAHNWQNAAAAWAACRAMRLDGGLIASGFISFPGMAHRMENIGRAGRVLFVNDSKATNADAAARSLASFGDVFWIAGGREKEGGIESLRPLFGRVARAYLIGEAAEDFSRTLTAEGVAHEICGGLEKAVARAAQDAARSDAREPVVLLAPACASFDQYASFEERGEHFRALAGKIIDAGAPEKEGERA